MRRILQAAVAVTGAVATLLFCVTSAGAVSGVTIRPGGAFSATGTLVTTGIETSCNVTLSGSFASSLVAIGGLSQVGSITGFSSARCTGFTQTARELPWAIKSRTVNEEEARYVPAEAVEYFLSEVAAGLELGPCVARGRIELAQIVRLARGTEYTASQMFGFGTFPGATCFGEPAGSVGIELITQPPSPTQTMTFLNGGTEVITGISPRPVDFGTVRTSEVMQRVVTIGSLRGGRIEEVTIVTGRYFAMTDPNECRGRTLAAHGSCRINVLLSAPTEAGRAVSDTLRVRLGGTIYEATLRATT